MSLRLNHRTVCAPGADRLSAAGDCREDVVHVDVL
jgi:hypothetical protein